MIDKPKESDWKAYSKLVPEARERYLTKVNASLAAHLQSGEESPTILFWKAEEKIREQTKILRECLDNHSRSKMLISIVQMLYHGLLTEADLEIFSPELRDRLLVLRDL